MDWVIRFAPEGWLIKYCHRVKRGKGLIGGSEDGDRVVRLSNNIAVKFGAGVFPSEVSTQDYAYHHANPEIVRVPRVYRYFQDHSDPTWPIGYLFMEYMAGQNLKELDQDIGKDVTKRLANIIMHLQEIRGDSAPGPVSGGKPQGYLWGDDGTRTVFNSVEDVNFWLNKRLKLFGKSIDLTPYPLVLCHMDLCRRNIILTEDRSICILDWGHAGFFPRFFEVAAIKCYNDAYRDSLLKATNEVMVLREDEEQCINLLMRARAASLRYEFETE